MQLTKKLKIKNFIVIFLFLINSATSNAQITKFTFFGTFKYKDEELKATREYWQKQYQNK